MATPMPGETGWMVGTPDSNGEYLVVDNVWWRKWLADWISGEGKRPGRWYVSGRPYCEADGIVCFRPLPRTPAKPNTDPMRDTRNHSES